MLLPHTFECVWAILLNLRWLAAIRAHLIVHAVTSGYGVDRVKPFIAPDVNLDVATEVKDIVESVE